MATYLQISLSAQVNGGPDATTDRWKLPFSAVRVSAGGLKKSPDNENKQLGWRVTIGLTSANQNVC